MLKIVEDEIEQRITTAALSSVKEIKKVHKKKTNSTKKTNGKKVVIKNSKNDQIELKIGKRNFCKAFSENDEFQDFQVETTTKKRKTSALKVKVDDGDMAQFISLSENS